jgi:peptidoglycan/LPS O-acetylase OafA/YrhL
MVYRKELDLLRAVSIIFVIGYHYAQSKFPNGYLGVDIFFIISGYLITQTLLSGDKNCNWVVNFYSRRVCRLLPSILVVIIVSTVIAKIIYPLEHYKKYVDSAIAGIFFYENFYLSRESGYFGIDHAIKPLMHLWSLSVEEQFYIFWPFLLLIFKNKIKIFILLIIISFIGFQYMNSINTIQGFFNPIFRIWEFTIGALIFQFNIKNKKANPNLSKLGFIIVITFLIASFNSNLLDLIRFPLIIIGVILILNNEMNTSFIYINEIFDRLSTHIGKRSYSIYLFHWPIYSFGIYLLDILTFNQKLIALILVLILSELNYKFIEIPIIKKSSIKISIILIGLAVIISIFIAFLANFKSPQNQDYKAIIASYYDKKNHISEYRYGSCFLSPATQKFSDFSNCKESFLHNNQPSIALWGDSHAAHLYPGIYKYYSEEYQIIQRTAMGCSPIIEDSKNTVECNLLNFQILKELLLKKPKVLILAARWSNHDLSTLKKTLELLINGGVNNIYIMGPPPKWSPSLPMVMSNLIRNDLNHDINNIGVRQTNGLERRDYDTENVLMQLSKDMGLVYISLYSVLCNEDGCYTRGGNDLYSFISFDYDHFTKIGSELFISMIKFINKK